MLYRIRFIHKIASRANDVSVAEIDPAHLGTAKEIGKELRAAELRGPIHYPGQSHVLMSGESVRDFRYEGRALVIFPRGSVWHSIRLERD